MRRRRRKVVKSVVSKPKGKPKASKKPSKGKPKAAPKASRPPAAPKEPPPPEEKAVVVLQPPIDASMIIAPGPRGPLENPVRVYMARLGTNKSRISMRDALRRVLRVLHVVDDDGNVIDPERFPWHSLNYEQLEMVRTKLAEDSAPSTANHALCAVRGVLRVAWKQGRIDTDTYQRAAAIEGVRGSRIPAGRHVKSTEVQAMFDACTDDAKGARDAVVLGMLYGCGLRRSELADARIEDLELETRSMRLIGKGNKEREVFLPFGTYQAVKTWVEKYRGELPGPLLFAVQRKKGGGVYNKKLTDAAIRKILLRIQTKAGLKHLSPHDLRRSFIGELLDKGADIATVQKLAGHASPTTTSRYDRRGDEVKRKTANMMRVPYRNKKKEDDGDEDG